MYLSVNLPAVLSGQATDITEPSVEAMLPESPSIVIPRELGVFFWNFYNAED
jgi:hypothetical protein